MRHCLWLAEISLLLLANCAGGKMLAEGRPAPPLSPSRDSVVEDIDGRPVRIEDLARQGPVVLVFLRGFS